ncbi:MAG: complex I subunit 5 family protein [bacterium]
MNNNLLPLFIAIPLGGAFLISMVSWKVGRLADVLGNIATFSLLAISLLLLGSRGVYKMGGWVPPMGINLVLDGFSGLMLIIVNLISFAATLFSIKYMEQYTAKYRYYSLFLLMVGGMNGVVLTGDIFNLFVFLEIASVASYALVAFGCEHEELEASFKYLVLSSIGSTLVLFGVAFTYGATGYLNMASISKAIAGGEKSLIVIFASVLFMAGFGIKAALVPFHPWLPDAHPSAPAPISAMLSGVLIKALGIYALTRVLFNVIGMTPLFGAILMALGALSMIVGTFLAVGQWDFKRLLAYSSIGQMGYVILGIGLGGYIIATNGPTYAATLAILGGVFHLANHAVFKSLLFLCSGSVEYNTGTRQLKEMGGLLEKMPLTGTTCTIASLSIAGVPPLNGFWSKLLIVIAAVQAGFLSLAVVTILASFITLVYFLKVLRYAFWGNLPETLKGIRESPALMCASMVILAILCTGMGVLLIPGIREAVLEPAVGVLSSGLEYAKIVLASY